MSLEEAWSHLRKALENVRPGCALIVRQHAAQMLMEDHDKQKEGEIEDGAD